MAHEEITCRPNLSSNTHLEDQYQLLEDQALALALQRSETHDPSPEQHEAELSSDGILDEAVARSLQQDEPNDQSSVQHGDELSEMVARALQVEFDTEHAHFLSKKGHTRRGRRDQHSITRSPDWSRFGAGAISAINKMSQKMKEKVLASPVGRLTELFKNETEVGVSTTAHHENHNPSSSGNLSNISKLQLQEDGSQNVIPDEQSYEEMLQLEDVRRGLSYETRSLLPIQTYKQNSKGNSDECIICSDKYKVGDVQMIFPCFHSFHAKCIDKWLEKETICPCCRLDFENSPSW